MAHENVWPEYLMIRDTGLHDDMGGGGQRIYTTAGRGYEKRKYVRDDLAALSLPVSNTGGWKPMETAPTDGTHCILAVKEDEFVYAVQGAFYGGHWNAVHRANVDPLCWMPNVRVPKEFLPWEKSE